MMLSEILDKLEELGITQCRGEMFLDENGSATEDIKKAKQCCIQGSIFYAREAGWVSVESWQSMISLLGIACFNTWSCGSVEANDKLMKTFDDFRKLSIQGDV